MYNTYGTTECVVPLWTACTPMYGTTECVVPRLTKGTIRVVQQNVLYYFKLHVHYARYNRMGCTTLSDMCNTCGTTKYVVPLRQTCITPCGGMVPVHKRWAVRQLDGTEIASTDHPHHKRCARRQLDGKNKVPQAMSSKPAWWNTHSKD